MPDPLANIKPLGTDPLAGIKSIEPPAPSSEPPPSSVMDPNKGASTIRRIGRTFGPPAAGMGVAIGAQKLGAEIGGEIGAGAGAATEIPGAAGAGAAIGGTIGAGIGGLAQPFVEYYARKGLGQNPQYPGGWDAAKSALFNAGFTATGEFAAPSKAAVAPEMERSAKTVGELKQAIRNRDYWKDAGLPDQQIDQIQKLPEDEQEFAATQIEQGRQYKQATTNVFQHVRGKFNERYEAVGGPAWDAPVQGKPIADIFGNAPNLSKGQPLSPRLTKWFEDKAREVQQGLPREYIDTDDPDLVKNLKLFGRTGKTEISPREIQQMRTELDHVVPRGASNTDKMVAQQVRDQLTQKLKDGLIANRATPEQVGALGGIDDDYRRFMEIKDTLDPRSENYGKKVADALFDPMVSNSGAGAEFIGLAKQADKTFPGTMDKLREAFLTKTAQESARGGPLNQLKVLRTIQDKWDDPGGRAILAGMFGKDSLVANPVKFAQMVGTPIDAEKVTGLSKWLTRAANAPWMIRLGVISAVTGGGILAATRDPTKAAEAVAALASLEVGGRLLGRLSRTGQEAYVNFRLNPNPDTFKKFMTRSGAMIGAISADPTEQEAPTP